MSFARRIGTAAVVAVLSLGVVTASASAADAGVSAKKTTTSTVSTKRDSWWY